MFDTTHNIYWYPVDPNTWRPEGRESASFSLVGNKMYVFGGCGNSGYNDMNVLDCSNIILSFFIH